jgi:hypothetical protein
VFAPPTLRYEFELPTLRTLPLLPTLRMDAKLPTLRSEQALPTLRMLAKLAIDQRLQALRRLDRAGGGLSKSPGGEGRDCDRCDRRRPILLRNTHNQLEFRPTLRHRQGEPAQSRSKEFDSGLCSK